MKKISVLFYLAIIALASYSNFGLTHLDSILTNPILDQDNKFVVAEREVKKADVIASNDVLFRVTIDALTVESLQFVIDFSKNVKNSFEKFDIAVNISSIATIKDYKAGSVDYFLSEEVIANSDLVEWFEYVAGHAYLNNMLVKQKDDGTYTFFVSVMPVDQDVDEMSLYRAAHQVMYDRDFREIDMYFGDLLTWLHLAPTLEEHDWGKGIDVDVFGWSVWRTLINEETFSFIFSVLLLGSLLPAIAMWFILGSFRQMLIALVGNVTILWIMRGLIGAFDLIFGFSFHEETYTILAYVPVIMLNFSFFMRHFKDFNALFHSSRRWRRYEMLWKDVLSGMSLKYSVYFVAFVTVADFAAFMLFPHISGARSMLTVATLAIFTIALVTVPFVRFVLPQVHMWIGGIGKESVELESSWFARLALRYSSSRVAVFVNASVIILVIVVATALHMNGKLITESNPGAFIEGTDAGPVMISLEASDQPGSGLYKVFIKGDLNNPIFVESVAHFVQAVRESGVVRGVISPTDLLGDVLQYDLGPEVCETSYQCLSARSINQGADIFDMSAEDLMREEWNLIAEEEVSRHFFSLEDNTLIVNVTGKASFAREMREVRDTLVELGSNIGAIGCDRIAQYPETDYSITHGAVQNYVGSPVLIGLVGIMLFLLIARVSAVSGFNPVMAGCIVVIPFMVSTAVSLIVMMVFGIYLDIATAAIGNITVSAAADLPVFLIVRFREVLARKNNFKDTLVSDDMVDEVARAGADVLVNALTYLPLAMPFFVAFAPILNLGVMLLVALASCYVGTILALPFLRWCVR